MEQYPNTKFAFYIAVNFNRSTFTLTIYNIYYGYGNLKFNEIATGNRHHVAFPRSIFSCRTLAEWYTIESINPATETRE